MIEQKRNKLREKRLIILGIILIITFASFLPTLHSEFTNWDDISHLTENMAVRSFNLKNIFTSTVDIGYNPLIVLSFALEYHFFGLNPFIYHLDNLLLHLVITGLIFVFALQMGLSIRVAAFTSLLFGIHPMHVESVAWIAERKDVLYAVFYMWALCCYLQYLRDQKVRTYLFTIVLGILSILAKPMALSLPLILFVCDWLQGRKFERKVFLEKIPHFMYIIPITWLTYSLNARGPEESLFEGVLIWIWSLTFYIQKFFLPITLVPLYPLPQPVSIYNLHYALAICILLLLTIWIVRYRRNRWLIFAILFYFASIFFLLRYDNYDTVTVADRYMYLPSVGVCVFLGVLFDKMLSSLNRRAVVLKRFAQFCLIVLFSVLCVKTYSQSKVWKNSVVLWTYVINKCPDKTSKVTTLAYTNRGIALGRQGKYDLAMDDFDKALETRAGFLTYIFNSRAIVHWIRGNHRLAIEDFNKVLAFDPNFSSTYNNRGMVLRDLGLYVLAMADFNKALELDPSCFRARNNRNQLYQVLRYIAKIKAMQEK